MKIENISIYIELHDNLKKKMKVAKKYYDQENVEIMNRNKLMGIQQVNSKGKKVYNQVSNPFASNEKLPSGFLKQQIKQKTDYLINENITLSNDVEEFKKIFPDWKKDIKSLARQVSYSIYGAWLFYLKKDELTGVTQLQKKYINGDEIYPIYKDGNLIKVLRHYNEENTGIEKFVEYDNQFETHYKLKGEKWEFEAKKPIVRKKLKLGDDVLNEEPIKLSQPPFAICYNNEEHETDLKPIKPYIDIYDKIDSDFANNILDFQEIYYTIKNFQGQDLGEFMNQLKKLKVTPIGEDGDVKTHQQEVPVKSKSVYLELTREKIYEFGMAVDLKAIASGKLSIMAINSMYALLTMKTDDFEQELQDFWRTSNKLINEFNSILKNDVVLNNKLIFDKTTLTNQTEIYERLAKFIGVLPDEIIFKMLPDIDETKVMELLEKEKNNIKLEE